MSGKDYAKSVLELEKCCQGYLQKLRTLKSKEGCQLYDNWKPSRTYIYIDNSNVVVVSNKYHFLIIVSSEDLSIDGQR